MESMLISPVNTLGNRYVAISGVDTKFQATANFVTVVAVEDDTIVSADILFDHGL